MGKSVFVNALDLSKHVTKEMFQELINERLAEEPEAKEIALDILDNQFEKAARDIYGYVYGMSFCFQPETLYYFAQNIQGKQVLEMAASSGENAILLGLLGADFVIINDLSREEIKKAQKIVLGLPENFRNKFELIAGDLFDLSMHTERQFDVILARNVIHFFKQEKLNQFNQLIHNLLMENGIVYLSANASINLFLSNNLPPTDQTVFHQQTLMAREDKNIPIHQSLSVIDMDENIDPNHFEFITVGHLHSRGATLKKNMLNPEQKEALKLWVDARWSIIQTLTKEVNLSIYKNDSVGYTADNIKQVLDAERFWPQSSFYIDEKGHVCSPEESIFTGAIFIKKQ